MINLSGVHGQCLSHIKVEVSKMSSWIWGKAKSKVVDYHDILHWLKVFYFYSGCIQGVTRWPAWTANHAVTALTTVNVIHLLKGPNTKKEVEYILDGFFFAGVLIEEGANDNWSQSHINSHAFWLLQWVCWYIHLQVWFIL